MACPRCERADEDQASLVTVRTDPRFDHRRGGHFGEVGRHRRLRERPGRRRRLQLQHRSLTAPVGTRGAGKLEVPDNITLLTLPPYSPELNPMENVWEFLRGNKLCSLVWNSYDAIVDACKKAWDFLISDPERIRSLGSRAWARVNL